MTGTKEHNDAVVLKLAEKNKIAAYAMTHLGCDEVRADAFVKTCGDYLEWTGVELLFKSASGKTNAITDPQAKGFFEREYLGPVFGMTKSTEAKLGAVDPELLAKAKGGNRTAQGSLFKQLHGDNLDTPIENAKTKAKLDKLLLDKSDGASRSNGSGSHATNPWRGTPDNLEPGSNKYSAKAFAAQVSCVRTFGPERAASVAAACGARLGDVRAPRVAS